MTARADPPVRVTTAEWSRRIASTLDESVTEVAASLVDLIDSPQQLIREASTRLLAHPGKGLRIRLTFLAGGFGHPRGEVATMQALTKAAACIELVHVASLVHDDVIDEADLRRGHPTVNADFGTKVAVLVGDHLLATAAALVSGLGNDGVLAHARAVQDLVAGEISEFERSSDRISSYLETVRLKTASLFTLAVDLASVVSGVRDGDRDALRVYAENYGIAFQLLDDLRDILLVEDGKSSAADLRNGVATLPTLVAATEGMRLLDVTAGPVDETQLQALRQQILGSAGPAWTTKTCRARLHDAGLALLDLPDIDVRRCLQRLLDDAEDSLAALSLASARRVVPKPGDTLDPLVALRA